MNLRCVAIDDEPLALNVIEGYIRKTPYLELVKRFTNPFEAIEYINANAVDLLFVDIQMPDISGLELVLKLKEKPLVVFTTAYGEYALEGFKADAIDYLLKPIDYSDFVKATDKAREWYRAKTNVKSNKEFLFIKSEYKIIRINFIDIQYIQGMSEYVKIFIVNQKPVMSLLSLKSLEEQLPQEMFMRVHKSYIVNLSKINMIERGEIIYDNGSVIPVSPQYKERFQRFIDQNFML